VAGSAPAPQNQAPHNSWNTPEAPKSGGFGGFFKSAAHVVSEPFKPFASGLARLLPGGQNDISANENFAAQAGKNQDIYTNLYRQGKINRDQYAKLTQGNSGAFSDASTEAKRIADSADMSQVIGSAAQVPLAIFAPGGGLLKNVAAGAGFGLANEISSNADPTLKGAAINTVGGAAGGGALSGLSRIFRPVVNKITGKSGSVVDRLIGANSVKGVEKVLGKVDESTASFLASETNPQTIQAVLGQIDPIKFPEWAPTSASVGAGDLNAPDLKPGMFDATNPPQSALPNGTHAPNAPDPVEVLSKQAVSANSPEEFASQIAKLTGEDRAIAESALNGKTAEEFYKAVKGNSAPTIAPTSPVTSGASNPPLTPREIRQGIADGTLDPNIPITKPDIVNGGTAKAQQKIDTAGKEAVPSGKAVDSALPPEDVAAIKAAGGTVPETPVAPSGTSAEAVKGDITPTPASASEVSANPTEVAKPQDAFVGTGKQADNQTFTKVNENPEISQQTKDFITNKTHEVRSPEQLSQIAGELSTKDPNAALALLRDDSFALKQPDAYTAVASNLINKLSTDGNSELGGAVYDQIIDHASRLGQGLNSIKLLYQITPQGQATFFERLLAKSGIKLTTEESAGLRQALKEASAIKDPIERGIAQHDIAKQVSSMIPSSAGDKVTSFWKAMLLSSPTTTAGNVLSNSVEAATMKGVVTPLASAIDKAISLVTGERSITNASLKYDAQGLKKGFTFSKMFMKTGFDPRRGDPLKKYGVKEVQFGDGAGGKLMNATVNGIFKFMGAQDQPFFYRELQSSLASQAKAAAINGGLKGSERKAFMAEFVSNPPTEAGNIATNEAYRAVFGNSTKLGKAAGDLQSLPGGNLIIPFTNVPASIATRVLERTPVGAISEIVKQISKGELDQRALSLALSNSTAGTAGALLVGKALVDHNLITLGYPTDKKEQQLWKLEGRQPYSIKMGNKWLSLNYVQPFGSIISAGAGYSQARKDGQSIEQAIGSSAAEAAKAVSSQSFLQGVSRTLSAVQEPGTYGSKFLESTAGSVVPNLIRHTATTTDPNQRQVNSPLDAVKSGIPKVRKSLLAQQDAFGSDVPKASKGLNPLLNPLKPSDIRKSDTTTELRRLQDAGFGAVPPAVDKNFLGDHKLTNAQINEINGAVGPQIKSVYQGIMSDTRYSKLTDGQKQSALQASAKDYRAVYKAAYQVKNGADPNTLKLTANQKALVAGEIPDYIAAQIDKSTPTTKKTSTTKAKKTSTKKATSRGTRSGGGGSSKSLDAHLSAFIPSFSAGTTIGNVPNVSRKSRTTPSFKTVSLPSAPKAPKVSIKL
jgi:hypothetical protein